jgi:kumamolisin
LKGSSRPAKSDAKRIGDADPKSQVEVTVSLRGPSLPGADNLPSAAISHEDFASKYVARQEDADKVARVLQGYGLKIEEVSLPGRSMRVSGTAAAMDSAFQAHLGIYRNTQQGEYRGREGELQIPGELEGIVTGVFGLDERRMARRKSQTTTALAAVAAKLAPLTPADLEKRYNFPPGTAAGQQIAIAEFDGGYFADDLQAFCAKQGRAVPAVTTVAVGLKPLTLAEIQQLPPQQRTDELGASMEVMMDVQIVAGLCPQAGIFVYFAPFTEKGWVDLLNKVMSGKPDKPVTLSVSWGLAEDAPDWSDAARTEINNRLQAAALLGITVCVASGDDGSGDQLADGRAHVNFPSSSPFVLSVGGTMLTGTPAKVAEQVWWEAPGERTNKGGGATGGGVSVLFARPKWQSVSVKSLNNGSIDGRVLPDIAALAGSPLYDLIFLGRDFPNGGTSASTPLWAALIARVNSILPAGKRQRFLAPLLYQNGANGRPLGASACQDITASQNASHPQPGVGYQAQAGYDAVTGWGVPNGAALLAGL